MYSHYLLLKSFSYSSNNTKREIFFFTFIKDFSILVLKIPENLKNTFCKIEVVLRIQFLKF